MQNNPKIIALLQALFYGFVTIAIPLLISALGQGGALNGFFSPTITVAALFILNLVDNQLQVKTGKAMFGMIR